MERPRPDEPGGEGADAQRDDPDIGPGPQREDDRDATGKSPEGYP